VNHRSSCYTLHDDSTDLLYIREASGYIKSEEGAHDEVRSKARCAIDRVYLAVSRQDHFPQRS